MSPVATGSSPSLNTIGMVFVASLAAWAASVPSAKNEVDLQPHELRGERRELLPRLRIAPFDHEILALDPSELTHRGRQGGRRGIGAIGQGTDSVDLCRLLRLGGERRETETQREERPRARSAASAPRSASEHEESRLVAHHRDVPFARCSVFYPHYIARTEASRVAIGCSD